MSLDPPPGPGRSELPVLGPGEEEQFEHLSCGMAGPFLDSLALVCPQQVLALTLRSASLLTHITAIGLAVPTSRSSSPSSRTLAVSTAR